LSITINLDDNLETQGTIVNTSRVER